MERKLFGTDGIRGRANKYPMTNEMALKIGKAVAKYFHKDPNHRPRIVVGKDTRRSGYLLEHAITSGIVSMGGKPLLTGPIPTPAVAHLVKSLNADAAIMITASHNPFPDNGIKIFGADGHKLPDEDELKIEKMILEDELDTSEIRGSDIGFTVRIDHAKGRYIEYLKNCVNNKSLRRLRIVVDCANGAASSSALFVFRELGCDVIVLNNKPTGMNINEECGALHPEVVQAAVLGHGADIGLALDGDADRAIFVDEKGNVIDGDKIMAVCALALQKKGKLNKNTVVATVMSNLGFENYLKEKGIMVVRTGVGDRYVLEEMRKNGYNFGGEQSGHIIFYDHSTTGDGLLTGLKVLCIMHEEKKKLSELVVDIPTYPQILVNIKVKEKKDFKEIPGLSEKILETEEKLGKDGRLLLRYSGTENLARVMIEGKDESQVKELANEIAEIIKREIGE